MTGFQMIALLDDSRRASLRELISRIPGDGAIAEVGVYRGGSLMTLHEENIKLPRPRLLFGFDTFEGLPDPGDGEKHAKGDFGDTSFESLCEIFAGKAVLTKGLFPASAGEFQGVKFAFVHLDMDYGQGTRDALAWFWPKMVKGGIIVTDDYGWPNCPNIKPVFDGFALAHQVEVGSLAANQAFVVKP